MNLLNSTKKFSNINSHDSRYGRCLFGMDTRNYLLLNKRVLSYGLKIYFEDPPTSKVKVNPVIENKNHLTVAFSI